MSPELRALCGAFLALVDLCYWRFAAWEKDAESRADGRLEARAYRAKELRTAVLCELMDGLLAEGHAGLAEAMQRVFEGGPGG